MQRLRSAVDTESQTYKSNYSWMSQAIAKLQEELRKSTEGGGEKYAKRHIERGRLLPRERIELLLDEGSYFLEIAPLAGMGIENESAGAGVIGGVGLVSGRECLIVANEDAVVLSAIRGDLILAAIAVHRVSLLGFPATVWVGLLQTPGIENFDFSAVKRCLNSGSCRRRVQALAKRRAAPQRRGSPRAADAGRARCGTGDLSVRSSQRLPRRSGASSRLPCRR